VATFRNSYRQKESRVPDHRIFLVILSAFSLLTACTPDGKLVSEVARYAFIADVYQTSQSGDNLLLIVTLTPEPVTSDHPKNPNSIELRIQPDQAHQRYYGFGASFTESSAWNLATIPPEARRKVLTRLFSPTQGAGFTLTRTHINSSDYSNNHYSYVEDGDEDLSSFSIREDMKGFSGNENDQVRGIALEDPSYDLVPMILEAQSIPGADFNIIASPWSPPSWMKTGETGAMTNGTLQPRYHALWAAYISRYITAYAEQGIDLWAITPQNEPLHAHDARWDSNGWSATEARDFLRDHLGPQLEKAGHLDTEDLEAGVRVLIYDHNKDVMNDYVAPIFQDPEASKYAWGTAFHWYTNSKLNENNWYQAELAKLQAAWPDKAMIHTESSIDIDADDPIGQYWRLSTDYAGEFVPFDTYAYDIISDLNHGTQGYVEWCVILSHKGQPNPYDNFNSAPVLINPVTDEVIYTPLYYLLSHFSKFIRPGAHRIGISGNDIEGVIYTAAKNTDGSIVVVAFNRNQQPYKLSVQLEGNIFSHEIAARAMQTIHLRTP
jgi:glucosylceramidase